MISARKAKHLDATTMFIYSDANTPLGQSERAYYLSYFIIWYSKVMSGGYFRVLKYNIPTRQAPTIYALERTDLYHTTGLYATFSLESSMD